MKVMILSLVLFFLLGLYLDNIISHSYGLKKHWCYCFLPSYWCGKKYRKNNSKNNNNKCPKIEVENYDEEENAFFETKYMNRENFEPVSREFQKQENENKILKVTDLIKTFDNGFEAVKGLNIKMYNG